MREYKPFFLLVLIMTGVALVVGATAIFALYRTALEQERFRLMETAQSQARLIEAIARFDKIHTAYPGGPTAATLVQIRDAHENFRHRGLGETGEFTLARRDGDNIVFLMRHRHSTLDTPETIPIDSGIAQPMRRALAGLSGTVIGSDYRGERVLAAYEPVSVLDLGIVAKIDLSEIQAPFLRTSWIVLAFAVFFVGSGTALFFAASEPIVQTIRESEHRFRELFEQMRSGAAIYEAVAEGSDFVFKDLNRAGERIDQVSRTDVIGKRLTSAFPNSRDFGLLDVLKRVWQTGKPERHPVGFYQDERLKGWRENYVYRLPSGEVVALYEDMTKQKQAEDALRISEARMRALLDASQDEILLSSTDGVVLAINRAAQTRLAPGAEEKSLVGSRIDKLLLADTAEKRMAVVERVKTLGKPVHFEEQMHGSWFDYWVYPVIRPSDKISEVALYARDISEGKKAESDLRKLYQAIEQSPASVIITDLQGNIEYVNPKFTDVTGYSFAESIGKNPRILKSGHTSETDYQHLWKTITSGRVWRGEFHNKKKNGDLFWELASIAPVRSIDGGITHFVAVKEDITQRKATEEQLRQSQKMQAIGQLTGGIAHDFNNLLAIIIGNLQLLQERVKADEKIRDFMADALWSAKRGAELTHRLLAFARRQPLHPDVVSLNEVVANMTDLLRRTLGATIEVEEHLAADLWRVLADRGELERALVNLAVNARDAMGEGGTLIIETRNVVFEQTYAEYYGDVKPGEYAMLAVTDTGAGMTPETMRRIFEPFFTTKAVGEGSGLGLSMVYGFIKQSGGHVSVYSKVGRGTTVKLHLPRAAIAPPTRTGTPTDVPIAALKDKVVLVVEDEAKLRKVAIALLTDLGLRVIGVQDANEALQRITELPHVDLLFTDIELTGSINGAELVEKVRELNPAIKVIYTTGYTRDAVLRGRGFQDETPLIPKPYNQNELASQVKAVLSIAAE